MADGAAVYIRGTDDRPIVHLASSGLRLLTPVEGLLVEVPWRDVVGLGIEVPVLPGWLWWLTLPVQALSGPTTAECREVIFGLARRSVPADEWRLGRPAEAPYSRRVHRLLDALTEVLAEANALARLADAPLIGDVMAQLDSRPDLGRLRSRKQDRTELKRWLGLGTGSPTGHR